MENSEFHEKSTPRVMEKRKIVNFTHKNTFLVWEMRMPPKAYKTNGILMIFAPKMQKREIPLKSQIFTKYRYFAKSQNFVKFSTFYRKVHFLVFCLPKPSIFQVLWKVFRLRPEFRRKFENFMKFHTFHLKSDFLRKITLFMKICAFCEEMRRTRK